MYANEHLGTMIKKGRLRRIINSLNDHQLSLLPDTARQIQQDPS